MSENAISSQTHIREPVSRAALWFGFLGGAIAWLLHLLLAYAIAEFGCLSKLHLRTMAGVSVVAWLLIGVSVAMTLVAAAATGVGLYMRKKMPQPDDIGGARGSGPYMARAGLITSAIFLFIIIVESIPILFYLTRC